MKRDLIILAEDDSDQQFVAAFKRLGYKDENVRAYEDGMPALNALEALLPKDRARAILVSDVAMGAMGGAALSRAVQGQMPDIPIMLWMRDAGDHEITLIKRHGNPHHALAKIFNDDDALRQALATTLHNFDRGPEEAPPAAEQRTPHGRSGGSGSTYRRGA